MSASVVEASSSRSWSMSAPEELGAALAKVAVFALVQALVFLILRKSSDVFSPDSRCRSFRPMSSMSVRRVLAAFSDVPVGIPEDHQGAGSAPSPSPSPSAAADDDGPAPASGDCRGASSWFK